MTQEEKAKAYDEALDRAKVMHEEGMMTERLEYLFPELKESEDEKIRKELIDAIQSLWDNDALPMPLSLKRKDAWIAWLERQGEQKPSGCNHIAELAEGEVTTSNGISEDMMSLRIEHTPLSERAKNLLRYQFNTIGDMVSYCDGKWRRLRALRNLGKVTYNEIMEYLGVDDRL